jgi:putative membrane protein
MEVPMQAKNLTGVVTATLVTLLVVLLVGVVLLWGGGMTGTVPLGMRGGIMPGGFGFGMPLLFGGVMMLSMLAVPLLVILGLVWLVVTLGRGSMATPPAGSQTPLDILKLRFARGEITKEQYDEMRQHLEV